MKPAYIPFTLLAFGCLVAAPVLAQQKASATKNSQFSKPLNVSVQIALLLKKYPKGGADMALSIQRLLVADISLVPQVIALVEGANPAQRVALAMGMADAANAPELNSPETAAHILKAAKSADPLFSAAVASHLAVNSAGVPASPDATSARFLPSPVVSPN
jgi:hypothetical protein